MDRHRRVHQQRRQPGAGAAGGVGRACAAWQAERGAQVFSLDRRRPEDAVKIAKPAVGEGMSL